MHLLPVDLRIVWLDNIPQTLGYLGWFVFLCCCTMALPILHFAYTYLLYDYDFVSLGKQLLRDLMEHLFEQINSFILKCLGRYLPT